MALPAALLFLLLITVMALAGIWYAISAERMATAQRQASLALAGADTAVRAGEQWLYNYYQNSNGAALTGQTDGATGIYSATAAQLNPDVAAFLQGARWYTAGTIEVPANIPFQGLAESSAELKNQPRYIIEDLGPLRPSGTGIKAESGLSGATGYVSAGSTPAGNDELRIYRVTGKSGSQNGVLVRTVQSTFVGLTKN